MINEKNDQKEISAFKDSNQKLKNIISKREEQNAKINFVLHDFSVPSENNFMERCLRMIKGKTKISGGFRSNKSGQRFGNTMSIIKTAKLRKLNSLTCIKEIYQGKSLFA